MARTLVVNIVGDASELSAALGKASAETSGFASKMDAVGAKFEAAGKHLLIAGAAVTVAAGEIGKGLVEAALNAQEQTDKLDVAFRNAGISAEQMAPQVSALERAQRNLAFSNDATRTSLTAFVNAGENFKQATKDMALADDLARTKGISLADATTEVIKVHQGLLRPLKELGISLPAAADHMEALTKASKASGDAITYHEKALATEQDKLETGRMAIELMTEKLHGQAQAYSDTAAGGMEKFHVQIGNIQESLGAVLLPAVTRIADALSNLADRFSALSPQAQKLISFGVVGAAAFGAFLVAAGALVEGIGMLSTSLAFLAANPIVLVVAGVALLAGAVAAAVLAPQQLESALERMGLSAQTAGTIVGDLREVFSVVEGAGQSLVIMIRDNWSTITAVVSGAVEIVKSVIAASVAVVESLWSTFGSTLVSYLSATWNNIKEVVSGAFEVVRGIFNVFDGLIHGDWSQMWNGIEEIVSGAWQMIKGEFNQALTDLSAAARLIGDGVLHGVIDPILGLAADVYKDMQALGRTIADVASEAFGWSEQIGKQVVSGVLSGLGDLASKFEGAVKSGLSFLHHPRLSGPPYDVARDEVGQPIVAGIIDGMQSLQARFSTQLSTQIHGALDQITPTLAQSAKLLGVAQTSSILAGVDGGSQTLAAQMKTALTSAMQPALAELAAAGAIQTAAARIGQKAADAVVQGVVGKQASMAQQIRTALTQAVQTAAQGVTTATSSFDSAFNGLASSALSAFDNVTSSYVAPATKQLDAMQLKDQVTQYSDAVKSAASTVQADQQALAQAQAGGDPAAIASAQAQLLADQQAYYAAARQQQEFQLSQTAAAQTKAYDKQRGDQRESLAKQLADLRTELAKNPQEWDKMGKQVEAILRKYSVPMYTAGQKFASDFASGISSQLGAAEDAARALADAVAKYIPRSPARTGPLAFSSLEMGVRFGRDFSSGITQGLYAGRGITSVAGSLTSAISGGAAALGASPAAGSSGMTVNITIPVSGSVIGATPRDIADELKYPIRDALMTIGRSEPRIFHGLA